jgi:hypothetical protein
MNFMPSQTIFAPATESYDADPGGPIDRTGEDWTEEQILLLASLVRGEGLSNTAAAARMGRMEPPIATAVSRYGARDPRAQLRVCIGYEGSLSATEDSTANLSVRKVGE